jgi:hypothetical protein
MRNFEIMAQNQTGGSKNDRSAFLELMKREIVEAGDKKIM